MRLDDPAASDPAVAGRKAATLSVLLRAGFPVPAGFVLPAGTDPPEHLGNGPLAVRSSAPDEDGPEVSHAGRYSTVLDVRGADLGGAVARCRASGPPGMAVLVQAMVAADAAGVALGADPLTGDRTVAVVDAVRGGGAPLVGGAVAGEQWRIGARVDGRPGVLTASRATAVAALLRRVERHLGGGPFDIEWALCGDRLWLLQARPMTALPDQVRWPIPGRGAWLRGIRLGEWLPEPVTPLFETWLLDRLERRFRRRQAVDGGVVTPGPLHALVNGWYFHNPIGGARQVALLGGLVRRPRLALATLLGSRWPVLADRLWFSTLAGRWRDEVLPAYRRLVADAPAPGGPGTVAAVDRLADAAGDMLWSLVQAGGAAWRAEVALARFHRRHLAGRVAAGHQSLLAGVGTGEVPAHAVHSLDWYRETLGRPAPAPTRPAGGAVAECRRAVPAWRRRRFDALLAVARRHAALRDEHAAWFTLPWPLLRRYVLSLGGDDAFFLTRAELLHGAPAEVAAERRAIWLARRRLPAPLVLGRPPFLLRRMLLSTPRFLRPAAGPGLAGIGASPGRATGPVRVLRDPSTMDAVQAGEVLVVPAAVPALAALFDRIAALVADTGSVAAHASIVAREYGIPAVVGLGDATSRLRDGDLVTVDGSTGRVEVS